MIKPCFFKTDNGTTVTVNSERYGYIITELFLPAIEEYDLGNMWFQQDVAKESTTRANMAYCKRPFLAA